MSSYMGLYVVHQARQDISQKSDWIALDIFAYGSLTLILNCAHRRTGQRCVLKLQTTDLNVLSLRYEHSFYRTLWNPQLGPVSQVIPRVYDYFEGRNYRALIIDLMGPSVYDLSGGENQINQPLKTVFVLALKMISLLQYIHSRSIYHLDIKDQNVVVGRGNDSNELRLIDFGLSLRLDNRGRYSFPGLELPPIFEGIEARSPQTEEELRFACRNRDFGSLLSMLMFVSNPNAALENAVDTGVLDAAAHWTSEQRIQTVFQNFPPEFLTFMQYYLTVPMNVNPDYFIMRRIFRIGLLQSGSLDDGVLRWTGS